MHDKPKVTIDLAEYNELIEKAKTTTGDEAQMAKEIIAALLHSLNNISNVDSARQLLGSKKIDFYVKGGLRGVYRFTGDDIIISKLD